MSEVNKLGSTLFASVAVRTAPLLEGALARGEQTSGGVRSDFVRAFLTKHRQTKILENDSEM